MIYFRKEEVSSEISEGKRLSGTKQMRNRHLIDMAVFTRNVPWGSDARHDALTTPDPGSSPVGAPFHWCSLKKRRAWSLSLPPPPLPPSPLLPKSLLAASGSLPWPWHPPVRHSRRRPWRCDHWTTILRPRHAYHHTPSSSLQFLHHVCRLDI